MIRFERMRNEYSFPEWVSLSVSLFILAFIAGLVFWFWLNPTDRPARFTVVEGRTRAEENLFYVDFSITNNGDETGQKVEVEGSITVSGHEEKASTVFDFVPGRSEEQGVLIFSHEPRGLAMTVKSYQKP